MKLATQMTHVNPWKGWSKIENFQKWSWVILSSTQSRTITLLHPLKYFSTSKSVKISYFPLFSIDFYRKYSQNTKGVFRNPCPTQRKLIFCMQLSIDILELWLKNPRYYICWTLNRFSRIDSLVCGSDRSVCSLDSLGCIDASLRSRVDPKFERG